MSTFSSSDNSSGSAGNDDGVDNGHDLRSNEEYVLEVLLLEAEVKKVQEERKRGKETQDLKLRAAALRVFLLDGDEEALALVPPVAVVIASASSSESSEKKTEEKGGRATLSDVAGKTYSVFKNSSVVKLLSESQDFRRACQVDRAMFC